MNREDIIRMAREAGAERNRDFPDWSFDDDQIERFAALVAAAEREHIASEFKHVLKTAEDRGATVEREECASVEVKLIVPERDYADLSPKEIYEEALIDAALAFRSTIRARGQ